MIRRTSRPIKIGKIVVGGAAPISVQSMTNTRTDDVPATVKQINLLATAGCDIVRIAIPDRPAAYAVESIKKLVDVPLVADIHFDYSLALAAVERGIDALRINPGNISNPEHIAVIVKAAKQRGIPIRIGVNAGSIEPSILAKYGGHPSPEAMVESALGHIALLEKLAFYDIKVSLKASDVPMMIKAYQLMAEAVNYPLHLGVTEAGTIKSGVIKSAVGIGALLAQGIGDTIRVSLTGDPVHEVYAGREILKALNLRTNGPVLISCPTCGRCGINLAAIAAEVEDRLQTVKKPIKVAVMGCIVNGPGEAREADIGIAGGRGQGLVFRKGNIIKKTGEDELVAALFAEIDKLTEEEG